MIHVKKLHFPSCPQIAIMIASHNEDTVGYTVNKMRDYGIHPQDRVICFGQLLGMCDHISLPLGVLCLTLAPWFNLFCHLISCLYIVV